MLGTALAQLRVAGSVGLGFPFAQWSLDRLVAAALATQHEFGSISPDGAQVLDLPSLDDATRRDMHRRRFRAQARRAERETTYYQKLFAELGLDPARLEYADIQRIPTTPKAALREDPGGFVRRGARPVLYARTTGTTGQPVGVAFSAIELGMLSALSALGFVFGNQLNPEDVVYLCADGRGIGAITLMATCTRIGALCVPGGVLPVEVTLARLATPLHLPLKKTRPSVLQADASYLGLLVEEGLRLGRKPTDFGIECILTGGEAVTAGLRARLPALFGDVRVVETYGMTETFGGGGQVCADGHVHFHPAHALVEVLDLVQLDAAAHTGCPGRLVVTPLPPFRETTLLLRYDTEDVVLALPEMTTCELRGLPAVSHLLGKRSTLIRHGGGWTYPREVQEALECLDDVPLPARFGMWAMADGVGLEVVVRADTLAARTRIVDRLEEHGVAVRELHLHTDRTALRQPRPLRCDMYAAGGGL